MKRALSMVLVVGAGLLASLWTLAALGAWLLLQAGATALDAQPIAVTLQAVMAWTERPWVRYWLDRHEAEALLDGVGWLLGLGGGPAVWLGSALALLGVALVLVWAGGLLLGAVGLLVAGLITRRAIAWWQSGPGGRWAFRQRAPAAGHAVSGT